MEIGQVIRKYRKEKDMTQEEMARRLGVTAPAVNKWESGASAPDIALLAPIARMLGITTDIAVLQGGAYGGGDPPVRAGGGREAAEGGL